MFFQLVNAAVIVDPSVKRVIASETDQVYPSSAPCDMTTSETIPFNETGESTHCQSVNREANASSEICLSGVLEKLNGSSHAVACLNPWQWSLQPHDGDKCSQWHPLRHASIVAIESSAARDRYLFPNSSESFGMDHSQPSSADSPAKKQKTSINSPGVSLFQTNIFKCSSSALTSSKAFSLTSLCLTNNRSKMTAGKQLLEILQWKSPTSALVMTFSCFGSLVQCEFLHTYMHLLLYQQQIFENLMKF